MAESILKIIRSVPTPRLSCFCLTRITASAVRRKGRSKMRGTLLSSSISRITKSARKVNLPTSTSIFSVIPTGPWQFSDIFLHRKPSIVEIHYYVEKTRILQGVIEEELGKESANKAFTKFILFSIVPSLSSSSHVFASLVTDRGNIIRWTTSFSLSLYLNIFARIP
ncbi:hypothetical protein Tco_0148905 [Tanacetum coccineum]